MRSIILSEVKKDPGLRTTVSVLDLALCLPYDECPGISENRHTTTALCI